MVTEMGGVLEHLMHKKALKRPGFAQLEEAAAKRTELIAVIRCLMGHYSQMEPNS